MIVNEPYRMSESQLNAKTEPRESQFRKPLRRDAGFEELFFAEPNYKTEVVDPQYETAPDSEFLPAGSLDNGGWGMSEINGEIDTIKAEYDDLSGLSSQLEAAQHEHLAAQQHAATQPGAQSVEPLLFKEDVTIPEIDFLEGLQELRMRDAAALAQEKVACNYENGMRGNMKIRSKQVEGEVFWSANGADTSKLKMESVSPSPEPTAKAAEPQRRRILRRRSSERKPFENVPDFVREELSKVTGVGHFTASELMCCLLFAHRVSLEPNSYAIIKAKMGNKRSRVSIRRKIEKIVVSETGLNGGLLGLSGDQAMLVLEALWSRLMHLISNAETYGDQKTKLFAAKLRAYAQEPGANSASK